MKQDKIKLLDILEEKTERHLHISVEIFQNLSQDLLVKAANNGGWSIAQCLEHLNSYFRYYLPAIEKSVHKNGRIDLNTDYTSSRLGRYFTRLMEPATGKMKFKAFKNHVPSAELDGYAVAAEFIQHEETLLRLIQSARKINLNAVKIPISIMPIIKLNMGDVFQFLIAHNERHIQQAQRNL